ncbi:unnamed protein product [Rotaria socialis]
MGLEQIFDASSDDHRSLTNMGTWIRPFSFITFNQGYAALLIGQLLPGLLASIFFNVVATFCSRWMGIRGETLILHRTWLPRSRIKVIEKMEKKTTSDIVEAQAETYRVYNTLWVQLLIYVLVTLINAMLPVTFSSIQTKASSFFPLQQHKSTHYP